MPLDDTAVDAIAVAMRVADAIEAAKGSYFVGGSLASSLQGEPRATNDIDMVLELPLGRTADFVAALGRDFEVDFDMLRDALLHGRSCNIFYLPVVMKVDLFAVGPSASTKSSSPAVGEFPCARPERRSSSRVPRTRCCASCSCTAKGAASRNGQWRDVVEVLCVSGGGMELGYLVPWSERLGISDLLERARSEAQSAT
jgi:hypothetical protein